MISAFFRHLFPKSFYSDTLRFRKTLYLGFVLVTLLLMLSVTGLLLLFYYSPESTASYSSVIFLEEKVFGGASIRALHRMCSHVLLITAALHLLRTVFTGVYRERAVNWKLGYIMFGLIIFEAYTGYLLPMDQLSFWATKTGMELMNTLPLGSALKGILMPDDVGGRLTLLRFFSLHIVFIPAMVLMLGGAHLYNIRRDGGLVPYMQAEKESGDRLIRFCIYVSVIVFVAVTLLSVVIRTPLDIKADPSTPPNPAKSAWFLLFIQEIVSWRASLFNLVAAVFAGYYFLPDMNRNVSDGTSSWFNRNNRYAWGITLLMAVFIILLTLIAMFFRGKNWELVSFYF